MKLQTFFFTTGFPIVEGGMGGCHPSYNSFQKTDALPWGARTPPPPLKNEAPHLKNKLPIEL